MFMSIFHSAVQLFSSQRNKILQSNTGGSTTEQTAVDKTADSSHCMPETHKSFVFLNLTGSVTVTMDFRKGFINKQRHFQSIFIPICLVLTLRHNIIRTAI